MEGPFGYCILLAHLYCITLFHSRTYRLFHVIIMLIPLLMWFPAIPHLHSPLTSPYICNYSSIAVSLYYSPVCYCEPFTVTLVEASFQPTLFQSVHIQIQSHSVSESAKVSVSLCIISTRMLVFCERSHTFNAHIFHEKHLGFLSVFFKLWSQLVLVLAFIIIHGLVVYLCVSQCIKTCIVLRINELYFV